MGYCSMRDISQHEGYLKGTTQGFLQQMRDISLGLRGRFQMMGDF